jgi:hypothetical protein
MNGSTTNALRGGLRLYLIACLAVGAIAAAAPVRAAKPLPVPQVPASLEVPEGNEAYLIGHALGTQNYICLPKTSGDGLGWAFAGPQATLFDEGLGQVTTHYLSVNPADGLARATWQHSRDTSTVWAAAIASSTDPDYVEAGAVAWLLLRIVGAEAGLDGGDRLTATTFIQRVNTVGGVAPAGDCPAVGARAFVPYATDYVFYRAR